MVGVSLATLEAFRVGLAFTAGAVTFFAPCAYPLLPGYVAYYLAAGDDGSDGAVSDGAVSDGAGRGGEGDVAGDLDVDVDGGRGSDGSSAERPLSIRLRRAAVVGSLASLGFFLVYAVLAGIALAVGTRALREISVLEVVVGAILVVLGVAMAAGRFDPTVHVQLPERRRSPLGFVLFGVVYAVAAAGCTAPVFVGIAAFALSSGPVGAVVTLGAYAAGMAVLMIAITMLSAVGKAGILRGLSRDTGRLTRVAGALLALAGVAQIYLYVFDFDWLGILELL